MLEILYTAERLLPRLLLETSGWNGIYADSEKPHLTRLWRQWGPYRINLHHFLGCSPGQAFAHPHPWPFAVRILSGRYEMTIGCAGDDPSVVPPTVCTVILGPGDVYEMTHPLGYHGIRPLDEESRTLMISGPPSWPENRVRSNATARLLTAAEMIAFRTGFSLHYAEPMPRLDDPQAGQRPATAPWIRSADPAMIAVNREEAEETAARLQSAITEIGRYELLVVEELNPEGSGDEFMTGFDITSAAIYLAWLMSLATAAENSGYALDASKLNGSMLPTDVSDEALISLSGGLADGEFIREVLKRYKSSLPDGKHLPDWVAGALAEDGLLVY